MHKDQHKTLFSKFKQISVHYFVLTKELEPRRPELSENFGQTIRILLSCLRSREPTFKVLEIFTFLKCCLLNQKPYISLSSFFSTMKIRGLQEDRAVFNNTTCIKA